MMAPQPTQYAPKQGKKKNSIAYRESIDKQIYDFLFSHQQFDYSINEIQKCLKIEYRLTVNASIKRLVRKGKITPIRTINTSNVWTYQIFDWLNNARYEELNRRW